MKEYSFYRGFVLSQRQELLGDAAWDSADPQCYPCEPLKPEGKSWSTSSGTRTPSPGSTTSELQDFLAANAEYYHHVKGDSIFCLLCKKSGKSPAHRVTYTDDIREVLEHDTSAEHIKWVEEYADGLKTKHEMSWRSWTAERRSKLIQKA